MTETIDTANLRALAEANKAWMKNPAAWVVPGSKGVAFFGSVLDGEKYEIGQVDTENYYQEPAALPLAQFIAAANPAAIIALLDRLAAAEARNATLTDEAARLDYLIDGEGSRCWVLPVLQGDPSKEGYCLQWMDCHDRITWQKGFFATAREAIDAAIQARAAASISTKEGDGHD